MSNPKHYPTDINDPHYMTPGARLYLKRVVWGYVVLAIAVTVGVLAITRTVDHKIRSDINQIAKKQCLGSIPTYRKFNEGLDAQIEVQKDAFKLNLSRGDTQRVNLNRDAIKKLQDARLTPPTREQCNKKLV